MPNQVPPPAPEGNLRHHLAVLCLDVAVLAEVTVSVYTASLDPELFTPVFLKVFFSMLIPTLLLGVGAIRHFRTRPGKASA
jgi:hypothetical protein